jgi:amino acid adenylation domain-containing protein
MTGTPTTLHRLLEESARLHPDRVAVEDPERGTAVTYREFDGLSDRARDALVRAGVGPGDRVGICAPKSISTLAAIFGVLKAGAAYVPVDPSAPPNRNAYIFRDCSVKAAFVAGRLAEGLRTAPEGSPYPLLEEMGSFQGLGEDMILAGGPGGDGRAREETEVPAGLSYILYTSGSTGRPKGVMHTHDSALSFVDWCSDTFEPDERDRFSSHAPFHFDLSILDIYVPLKHGAALVLIGEELGKQPARLAQVISERRITAWYSAPSILRLLVEHGRLDRHDYSELRLVLFAGEVFPLKHLRALKSLWAGPRYFNLYGPTETNVCTFHEIPAEIPEGRNEPFPIGAACANDRTLVMDEQDREVPPGEEGELYVSGGSVMQGYWNLPDRTAQAFFRDGSGVAWYRTGDVVRDEGGGVYAFLGRRDRMVKRRGNRIELGEIEAGLYRHPAVAEAAVIALPDEENGVLIKAFLSCSGDKRPSLVELKRFCAENLPSSMVPDRFSFQTSLPKTSTDKVDYQRLALLD